ncbi:MAG TPA: hypothetical protein VFS21_01590 [Roseiflexaceae bacterium]|nr:hypothetical protein [Roseiflexaceae bacterium]
MLVKQHGWARAGLWGAALLAMAGVLALIWLATTPALTAEQACRARAMRTEGYGPWRLRALAPADDVPGRATVVYNDGFNTLSCGAVQIAGVWFVEGAGQNLVMCGHGLGVECRRAHFGVE